jgi:hypothetical protein
MSKIYSTLGRKFNKKDLEEANRKLRNAIYTYNRITNAGIDSERFLRSISEQEMESKTKISKAIDALDEGFLYFAIESAKEAESKKNKAVENLDKIKKIVEEKIPNEYMGRGRRQYIVKAKLTKKLNKTKKDKNKKKTRSSRRLK